MEENIAKIIKTWRENYTQFQHLQICYVITGIISLVLAGLITLLNQTVGQSILVVSKISFLTFLINAMVNSFLPQTSKSKRK